MRLICPNCEAQYEVDAAVIPDEGRDVQCSNCGHIWLQMPEGAEADEADAPEAEVETPAPPAKDEPKRRPLDEAVLNVLREEAERETAARRDEGSSLEMQEDLGLVAGNAAPARAPEPVARPEPQAEPHEAEAVVTRAAKRELLPDIEEINSTLRPTAERGQEAAAQDAPQVLRMRRNDFRKGFLSSLTVACLLLVLYTASGAIAARVPALAPVLTHYAQTVDSIRLWLDQRMRSTTESLQAPSNG